MKTLPILYKKTSTDAQQEWLIGTDNNVIVTRWGQTGGKIQETRDTISSGKNIGKANETTPTEQAEMEALALWEKKKKKGYYESVSAAMADNKDGTENGIFPMLAHRFDQQEGKLKYPCFVQPKLDGHRCIAVIKNGKATLWTRTKKPIISVPHIIAEIENMNLGDIVLDGELYNHDYKNKFEELTSFIRQQDEPKPGHECVQYHIYDLFIPGTFQEREKVLKALPIKQYLKIVETNVAADRDELQEQFEKFLSDGYEGAIARNFKGIYENKRSYNLLKLKSFMDDEFLVVNVYEGRGKLAGHALFECETKTKQRFGVKMKGDMDELKTFISHPEKVVGKMLTVQFQDYTTLNDVPRFPVGIRIREDI